MNSLATYDISTRIEEALLMAEWGKIVYNKARNHFAVVGTWQGERHYFSQIESRIGRITCTSKSLAERLKRAINIDIDRGVFVPARYKRAKSLHLSKFSKNWLAEIKSDVALGTWHGYETAMRLYIEPALGHLFLADIGHPDLKNLMQGMNHLQAKTKRNVLGVLHAMMSDARRDGHLTQLPPWIEFRGSNEVVPPGIRFLSVADQMRIVEAIHAEHRPIFLFMMATGCRPSEARALRKIDVHEDHIMFEVAIGYKGELKAVKQKRSEPFPLHAELREILEMAPPVVGPHVFPNPNTGQRYSKEINKIWNRACDRAGVKRIRLYQAVRHSFACQLLNAGVEEGTVSRLLRHSDPRMIKRYAKYEVEILERAAGKVKRLKHE